MLKQKERTVRVQLAESNDFENGKKGTAPKKRTGVKIFLCVATFFVLTLGLLVATCHVLLNGPSHTVRDALVLSATQASATKWLPGLFLDDETVRQIEQSSKTVTYDVFAMEEIGREETTEEAEDPWASAIDGIRLVNITKPHFKAYLLMVKDPSRLFVGTSSDFSGDATVGKRIFEIAEQYQAVAVLNGGEFPDNGVSATGSHPIGITYSQGELVWKGPTNRTFMGFTDDHRLVVSEGMTEKEAQELGIRDGVCFQTGNCLITNDGKEVTLHYSDGNTGRAQRSAIGQCADGTVLLLVTDGRCASSLGATHNDLIEIMLEYKAVCAGKLDGGSSATMYYRDYYNLYNYDLTTLDEYQKKGLVNQYKAFTKPRKLPTFFIVGEAEE